MKRYLYITTILGLMLLLNSCLTEPSYPPIEPWLCSVNADGTGFRKIKKVDMSFGTTGFWDIYMTKDNRIIFYGEKLWISETDTIIPVSITDNIYTLQDNPARLSQSPDGSKLYFASRDKNIHELDLNTMLSRQLTTESVRTLRNPIVSDLGNYITYSSRKIGLPLSFPESIHWMNLNNADTGIVPTIDSVCVNVSYAESENFVYYQSVNIKRSRLDGSELSVVTSVGNQYPDSIFGLSSDQRYIIYKLSIYPTQYIRFYDKSLDTVVQFPVANNYLAECLARISKDTNILFYVSPGYPEKLHAYYLDTGEDKAILQSTSTLSVSKFINLAPTWDGSKVYFYADVSER